MAIPALAQLIGQDETSAYLRRIVHSGRYGNAYLFHGPSGVGKTDWIRTLVISMPRSVTPASAERAACTRSRICAEPSRSASRRRFKSTSHHSPRS